MWPGGRCGPYAARAVACVWLWRFLTRAEGGGGISIGRAGGCGGGGTTHLRGVGGRVPEVEIALLEWGWRLCGDRGAGGGGDQGSGYFARVGGGGPGW